MHDTLSLRWQYCGAGFSRLPWSRQIRATTMQRKRAQQQSRELGTHWQLEWLHPIFMQYICRRLVKDRERSSPHKVCATGDACSCGQRSTQGNCQHAKGHIFGLKALDRIREVAEFCSAYTKMQPRPCKGYQGEGKVRSAVQSV